MEKLYHLLYPMRVVLITSAHNSRESIMAAAWCFPVSAEPPVFGVCISKKRFSHELIRNSRQFAINIPGTGLNNAVLLCGRTSGKDTDKFALANLTREKGQLAAPLIKECLASIECRLVNEFEIGDHILFAGHVVNVVKRKEGRGLYHAGDDEFKEI